MDDVLIYGADKAEHDSRLKAVLERLQTAGVTLNSQKCEFYKRRIRFLGHIIDGNGIHPDPQKVSAVLQMERPRNVGDLRRFMGMANQLGKFPPNLAELSQPLRELLSTKRVWSWGPPQEKSFTDLKQELTQPAVLRLYNPEYPTKVSADASSHGLGVVLLQQSDSAWRPVAYASRAMTETEKRYAQIEKEALAATWACERFSNYVLGRTFLIESDHKPLIPLSTRNIWMTCLPASFDSGYAWPDLITQSNMFQGSYYTQQTLCLELHWIQRMRRPQIFQQRLKPLWTVLFSHYLQRHGNWTIIEEPKRRTLFVQKLLNTVNPVGLRNVP